MEKYLSFTRQRPSRAEHNTLLASTQSDRARLIYSAPFRRLQQKAQVFSLESNSSVRSRLSHSIEVSHIGRYIVASICEKITKNDDISDDEKSFWANNSLSIANVVETACLAHDIGNPPFGHFGEAAIVEWATSEHILKAMVSALNIEQKDTVKYSYLIDDFKYFDGNPQGFRILTRLQGEDGYHGLNLTNCQLAAFLKYTFCPGDKREGKDNNKPFRKKIGFFDTEKYILEKVWEELGMAPNTRHPLGFLMEASDDISYCISDIEDGIEKGIITVNGFAKEIISGIELLKEKHGDYEKICNKLIGALKAEDKYSPVGNFLDFKTKLSNFLVDQVSTYFVSNYNSFISLGVDKEIIMKGSFEYDLLNVLKQYTLSNLFTSYEAEKMELSGFSIIKGILNEYLKLISLTCEEFSSLVVSDFSKMNNFNLAIERRLFNRLPEKHLNAYKTSLVGIPLNDEHWTTERLVSSFCEENKLKEWNLRIHLIIDFVSGMTDQFSMEMYQLLKGIAIK